MASIAASQSLVPVCTTRAARHAFRSFPSPSIKIQSRTCSAVPAASQAAAARHAARFHSVVARAAADPLADLEEPETAQDAINQGLKFTAAGRWREGLDIFERALSLPGTGIKRYRDKPRAASDRERMTALYNIACCHSQLQDARSGLVALAGCLELGYADFAQIMKDPDLDFIRQDSRFMGLLQRFQPSAATNILGFDFSNMFGKK